MFNSIIDAEIINDKTVWVTDSGRLGTSFLVDLGDLETFPEDSIEGVYAEVVSSLATDVYFRVQLIRDFGRDEFLVNSARGEFISLMGHMENALILHFETQMSGVSSLVKGFLKRKEGVSALGVLSERLLRGFDLIPLKGLGLNVRSLGIDEVRLLFPERVDMRHVIKSRVGVDFGTSITGVIRLVRPGTYAVGQNLLASTLSALQGSFEVRILLKKKSPAFSEGFLRRMSKRAEACEDRIGARKFLDTQETLEKVALGGDDLVAYEFFVLFKRNSEAEVRQDATEMLSHLRSLGDFYLETVGAIPSFMASVPGGEFHVSLFETTTNISAILPVSSHGRGEFNKIPPLGSLLLHRRDASLDEVNVFNPSYENHSVCVFGTSGKGKSVFTNLLTDALLSDPQNYIIKVDVGGSHSRQTQLAGGVEYNFAIDRPSNIDPFRFLSESPFHKESAQILSSFLEVLLLEEHETKLSKALRQELESAVLGYAANRSHQYGFEDFVKRSKDLPRKELLKRWTRGGVFENAFKCERSQEMDSRLRYYNFAEIFQAQDPDFAQAGFSAVMALFNFEGLLSKDRRLIFVCDETPFFIKKCFNFFHLSIANVRKLGHSFITICQKSSDAVVGGDTSILDNSHVKVLFSVDGDEKSFKDRLKVGTEIIERIKGLRNIPGQYSEMLLMDNSGARTFVIRLSPEELYRYTTKKSDLVKIKEFQTLAPSLSLEEVLKCLSITAI